eukprot:7983240-Pyramimonas_sp.AAC.1
MLCSALAHSTGNSAGRSASTSGASPAPRSPVTFPPCIGRSLPCPTDAPRKLARTCDPRIHNTSASRDSLRSAVTLALRSGAGMCGKQLGPSKDRTPCAAAAFPRSSCLLSTGCTRAGRHPDSTASGRTGYCTSLRSTARTAPKA